MTGPTQSLAPPRPAADPSAAGGGGGPSIADYLGVLKRRPGLIVAALVAGLALGGLLVLVIPPKYEAMTVVKVTDAGLEQSLDTRGAPWVPHKPLLASIRIDILNRGFLENIVTRIGLSEGFDLRDRAEKQEFYDYIKANLRISLAEAKVGADTITIKYGGRDPRKVEAFVNEVRTEYIKRFNARYVDRIHQRFDAARNDLTSVTEQLERARASLSTFRDSPEGRLVLNEEKKVAALADKRLEHDRLQREVEEAFAEERQINLQIDEQPRTRTTTTTSANPAKQAKAQELLALQTKLAIERDRGLTNRVVIVAALEEAIQTLQAELQTIPDDLQGQTLTEANPTLAGLEQDKLEILRRRRAKEQNRDQLALEIRELQRQLEALKEHRARGDALTAEVDRLGGIQRKLDGQFVAIRGVWERVKGEAGDPFEVTEWPWPGGGDPVFPSVPMFLLIGGAMGLLIGVGLAFVFEFSKMTFTSSAQVQSFLPVAVLGEVGTIRSSEERRAASRRKVRRWIVLAAVVLLVGGLHVCYFSDALSAKLPSPVVRVMDKIYQGR